VLPPDCTARVSVEKSSKVGWGRYINDQECIVGMKTFGASAPLKELMKKFGFTVENVIAKARLAMERNNK
jgi:transketolase